MVDSYHIWSGTQEELNEIAVRDSRTIYLVKNNLLVYSITNNLTCCTVTNTSTTINKNNSYTSSIVANNVYKISSITVTMGNIDVTVV